MAYCSFSGSYLANNKTEVDNIFINDYLPYAPAECVKVYLYGLMMCHNASSFDNSIESFSKALKMSKEDIESCYLYWQEQGLVQIVHSIPIEIKYIPLTDVVSGIKKYNDKKYSSFNAQVQELFSHTRMISTNEYSEYYYLIEELHIEPEALIMIISYCIKMKGENVGYKYILAVAKNWANSGLTTVNLVEEHLQEIDQNNVVIEKILKLFGKKRPATLEEKELYKKWTNELDFGEDVILAVAQEIKKLSKPSFLSLDKYLTKYFENHLMSVAEINEHEANKTVLYDLARKINKEIGVYYDNLEVVVDTYVTKWVSLGCDEEYLLTLAKFAFKNSIRTLEKLDNYIMKFYKLGIVTKEALSQYIGEISETDNKIKDILVEIGVNRNVNNFDREKYKTWTREWNLSDEIILYASSLANGKLSPMGYLSTLLSIYHDKNVKTVEQAKAIEPFEKKTQVTAYQGRSYSNGELNAMFQSIDEIDI